MSTGRSVLKVSKSTRMRFGIFNIETLWHSPFLDVCGAFLHIGGGSIFAAGKGTAVNVTGTAWRRT